jgi:3-oxoacyl-[acyl-carrier protein] reductase
MTLDLGLEGRTAIISGSTRGVGFAVAEALARAGAKVAINYLKNEQKAQSALDRLTSFGGSAIAVKADVSTEEGALKLVTEAYTALGNIDILVNNAHGNIIRSPFEASSWDEHQSHLDAILRSAFFLTRAVKPGMKEQSFGRIVNIGNNMVLQPIRGYSALTSSMAALLGFTRNLAAEAGPWGVTVNMVSPGFVMTGDTPNTTETVLAAITEATPLKRLATPEDIAGAVLFFCSDLSKFVTGANLSVDGGKVMG